MLFVELLTFSHHSFLSVSPQDQHPNEFEKSNPYYKPASGICEPVYEDMSAGKQHINPYYKPAQETTKVDDGYVAPSTEYIEPDEVKI